MFALLALTVSRTGTGRTGGVSTKLWDVCEAQQIMAATL